MQYQNNRIVSNGPKLAAQLGLIGLAAALHTPLVWAGDVNSKVPLNIPSQDLSNALTALATQAELQILFSQELVAGKVGAALSGEYSGNEALQRLLAQADLEFTVNGKDIVVIRARQTSMFRHTAQQVESGAPVARPSGTAVNEDAGVLEEILVTAQKRTERLQDVPIAITAISGDALEQTGTGDTSSLTKLAPSLTFTQGNHPNNSSFRIRGVGTAVFGLGLEPDVSVVVDGVVMARAVQGFSDLADIDRVEVLRGPQGTLFGKNAIAGLLNVTTKRPAKQFEGNVDATWAEGDEYRLRGSVSGPLTDTLRARVSGYYNDVGGWYRNVTLNEDSGGSKSTGVRTKLEWDATDDLNFLLTNDYRYTSALCCGSTYVRVENTTLQQLIGVPVGGVWSDNNFRKDFDNVPTWYRTKSWIHALEANWKLPSVTLTSVTAYQNFDFDNNQPIDRVNTPVPLNLNPTNGQFDVNGGPVGVKQFTQELRLTSPGGQRFNYVTGLYYLNNSVDRGFRRRNAICQSAAAQPLGQPCVVAVYRSQGLFAANEKTEHMAAFAQADLGLVGGLSALGGVRLQRENLSYWGVRDNSRMFPGDAVLPGNTASSGSGKSHDSVVTGKAGLKYEFNRDSQMYMTWARGYKGAAYEIEFAADFDKQVPVQPETVTSYELGYKGRLFDELLTVNAAVFYSDFTNLQVQANRGDANAGIVRFATTNAGSASTEGAELEFTVRPFKPLTLSGGVTYLQTSVDINGLQCPLQLQNAAIVMSGSPENVCYRTATGASPIQNVSGGVLPMASKWRGTLTARYEQALGSSSVMGFGQISANSQSKFNFVIEQDPMTEHPGYTLVDASVGIHDADDRYRLTVFVKNVFDKHYLTALSHASTLTTSTLTPGNMYGFIPKDANRYFGVTFGASF